MPSPAKKKRKLNDGGTTKSSSSASLPSRGLEYFFAKQKQTSADANVQSGSISGSGGGGGGRVGTSAVVDGPVPDQQELTDEELARKLQAEWDREAAEAEAGARQRRAKSATTPSSVLQGPHVDSRLDAGTSSPGRPTQTPDTSAGQKEKGTGKGKGTLSLQAAATSTDTLTESISLDESPLTFDPAQYIPQLKQHWAGEGEGDGEGGATYALLTRCFVLVSGTTSRIKIVDTLVNFLRLLIEGDPDSLLPAVWLSTNAISPPYISRELGLGGSAISKALRQACGLDARALKALYDRHGDAGDVAFEAKRKQSLTLRRPRPLTVRGVYRSLVHIADSQGPGSVEAKQRVVDRLLRDARGPEESRYVVRTLCQHLRIGAVKTTVLIALARAFTLSRPPSASNFPAATRSIEELRVLKKEELAVVWARAEEIVKACFARRPDYNHLVPVLLEVGVGPELLRRCALTPHVPLRPMLGSITRDLPEMLARLRGSGGGGREFACEFKYDGQRAQVHCDADGRVSIFSRHLELITAGYPDLVALVPQIRGPGVSSFVLEGEVVAVDVATGALRDFQTLTARARKGVALADVAVSVCLFAFDLMYLDGEPLLARPFRERRALLRTRFVPVPNRFTWVRSLDAAAGDDPEPVLDFFRQALDAKCEGIMVKLLDNPADAPQPDEVPEETAGGEAVEEEPPMESEKLRLQKPKGRAKQAKVRPKPTSKSKAGEDEQGGDKDDEKSTAPAPTSSRRKPLLATYEPDKRLDSWLKVKKDYDSAAAETLDLVPVAAWHGQGRKARWWSPVLLAVRNDESGQLEAVCKCMSGFTDAFYRRMRAFYDDGSGTEGDAGNGDGDGESNGEDSHGDSGTSEHDEDEDSHDDEAGDKATGRKTRRRYRNTRGTRQPSFVEYRGPAPDVWFEPREVWEVAFADVTLSPTYTAALGLAPENPARGLSLRFPRFLRRRDDKSPEDASSAAFLAQLWRKQVARAPAPNPDPDREPGPDSASADADAAAVAAEESDPEGMDAEGES